MSKKANRNNSIEFLMNEEIKVTISSSEAEFSTYFLGIANKTKDSGNLVALIVDSLDSYCKLKNLRPSEKNAIYVHVRLHSKDIDKDDYTVFGFFQNHLETKISAALFNDWLDDYQKAVEEYKKG